MTVKNILCFGDSNTYGSMPHVNGKTLGRYDFNMRWPGRLQNLLGEKYHIVEDGLGGRTTIFEETGSSREGRCGLHDLPLAIKSIEHLDLVILMLGSNDMKIRFGLSAKDIAANIEQLLKIILDPENYRNRIVPKLLLLSPPVIDQNNPEAHGNFPDGDIKSLQLGIELKDLAEQYQILFLDIAKIVRTSKVDGMHLEPSAHAIIAEKISEIVRNLGVHR